MFTNKMFKTSLLAASLALALSPMPAAHAGGLTSMVKGVFTATGDVLKGTARATGDVVKGTARAGGAACAATGRAVGTTASAVAGATGDALTGSVKAVGNTTSAAVGATGDLLGMHHKNNFGPTNQVSNAPATPSKPTADASFAAANMSASSSTEGTRIQAPVQEIVEISQPRPQLKPVASTQSPSWNDSPSWNEQQPRSAAAAFSNQYALRTTPLKASSH